MGTTITIQSATNTITLDNAGAYEDANGVRWTCISSTGIRDSAPVRTNYTTKPLGWGAYDGPVFPDKRVITIKASTVTVGEFARLTAMRQARGILADGSLGILSVTDELGTVTVPIRLSDATSTTPVGQAGFDVTWQFTAADPRMFGPETNVVTLMAQTSGTGIPWLGPRNNLLANQTFESDINNWTTSASGNQSSLAHSGNYSLNIQPNGSSSTSTAISEKEPVTAGKSFEASAWVYFNTAVTANFSMSIQWYNASNSLLSTSTSNQSVAATAWTKIVNTATAPVGATQAAVAATLSGTPAAANSWFLDDVYFGTAATGLQWRGTDGLGGILWRGTAGGNATSGNVSLDNTDGTAPADIEFSISGPALNPTISTSNSIIRYGGVLGASDVLVINTGTGSVLLNGGNRRPYLTSAQFFQIPPGQELNVKFSAEIQNSTASMAASYSPSFL